MLQLLKVSDSIQLSPKEVVILNRKDFEDNYHQLQGSSIAMFQVVSKTENTVLISELFQWQLELFKLFPTEMGSANANLMFAFLGMFVSNKRDYIRTKAKVIYALKETDCDDSIIEWFETGGKDSCFAKTENEWFKLIIEIIGTDHRTCEEINALLTQGCGTEYDRIAIRVKGILDGYQGDDTMTFIIRRVMERLKII